MDIDRNLFWLDNLDITASSSPKVQCAIAYHLDSQVRTFHDYLNNTVSAQIIESVGLNSVACIYRWCISCVRFTSWRLSIEIEVVGLCTALHKFESYEESA